MDYSINYGSGGYIVNFSDNYEKRLIYVFNNFNLVAYAAFRVKFKKRKMKYTEFLLATGDTLQDALTALKKEMNEKYSNQQCKVQQLFALPEGRASGTLGVGGIPTVKYIVNLVAVIDEEPEIENLQRNFKPAFDFVNTNRDAFLPIIMGWLAVVADCIPEDKKQQFVETLNKQTPFNE